MKIKIVKADHFKSYWYSHKVGEVLDAAAIRAVGPRLAAKFEVRIGETTGYIPAAYAVIVDANDFGECVCGGVATVTPPSGEFVFWGCANPTCVHCGTTPRPSAEHYPSWVTPSMSDTTANEAEPHLN